MDNNLLQDINSLISKTLFLVSLAEPYGNRSQQGPYEPFQASPGFPKRTQYRRHPRVKAKKSMALSAPPDKDPVMLLNEYGQKRGQLVSTNSGTYPLSRALFCLLLNQGREKEAVPKGLFTRREGYPSRLQITVGHRTIVR